MTQITNSGLPKIISTHTCVCVCACVCVSVTLAATGSAQSLSDSSSSAAAVVVVRIYAGAPYGTVVFNVTTHLHPVGHLLRGDRRIVAVSGGDVDRFRLTDGGRLLVVGEYPELSGRVGDEYVINVTSLGGDQSQTTHVAALTVRLRVLVSRENASPPRFIRTSPLLPTEAEDDAGNYSADVYRFAVVGTPVRMRRTVSVSDDDIDEYNRAVTFSLRHSAGRRRQLPDRYAEYLSIDSATGQLSSGRLVRQAPAGIMPVGIVAANSVASPPLSSSINLTVYVCDVPGVTNVNNFTTSKTVNYWHCCCCYYVGFCLSGLFFVYHFRLGGSPKFSGVIDTIFLQAGCPSFHQSNNAKALKR